MRYAWSRRCADCSREDLAVPDGGETFALFRVAAGARIGFGHLRRATTLASALERSCAISLRGSADVPSPWHQMPSTPAAAFDACRPRLLVVDDPRTDRTLPWLDAARRAGVPCATVHDLGLGAVASDLAIDGSLVTRRRWSARATLVGPRFAVLGLRPRSGRRRRHTTRVRRILVSLGGGDNSVLVRTIVRALREALPDVRITVPRGFGRPAAVEALATEGVEVVAAPHGLADLLDAADIGVVAGGVTLYEAAAAGLPVVALPIVTAQRPTVQAFGRAGLAVPVPVRAGGLAASGRGVARCVASLAGDVPRRRAMSVRGPAVVDGRGTQRVIQALVALAETGHA